MSELNLSEETISELRAVTIEESKKHPGLAVDVEDILKDWIERYWATR
jgi:hypothetical protein